MSNVIPFRRKDATNNTTFEKVENGFSLEVQFVPQYIDLIKSNISSAKDLASSFELETWEGTLTAINNLYTELSSAAGKKMEKKAYNERLQILRTWIEELLQETHAVSERSLVHELMGSGILPRKSFWSSDKVAIGLFAAYIIIDLVTSLYNR